MDKEQILKNLKKLDLNKEDYIVISGASLVMQGIIDKTNDIDLSTTREIYDKLPWNKTMGKLGVEIKYLDPFEISYNLYDPINIEVIDGYKFMNLEKCLEVKKLCNKKEDKKIIEKLDLYLCSKDNRRYEKELYQKKIKYIAGVDEVGRGPLVGPVVACCCVLDRDFKLDGLTDSKKLSEKKRNEYSIYIKENCLAYGLGVIGPDIIDEVNIYEATKLAMKQAIDEVRRKINIEHVLIDAMPLDLDIDTTSIIKGDIKSISIAAASVIAKVERDKMMYELDLKYPEYGYASHKGYPTKKHVEAIQKYGLIEGYRKSYSPVKELIEKGNN